jgi:hypothetical protein
MKAKSITKTKSAYKPLVKPLKFTGVLNLDNKKTEHLHELPQTSSSKEFIKADASERDLAVLEKR